MVSDGESRGIVRFANAAVAGWIGWVCRYPVAILIVILALVLGSAMAASGLRIDTDSSKMLSADLPFQQRTLALNQAFPTLKNTILVVIRADTTDAADLVTGALAARLVARPEIVEVFAPSVDPYLVSHGLLYEDVDTLDRQLARLSQSADFLAELRKDQSVPGFFRALARVTRLAEKAEISPAALAAFYRETLISLRAAREGETRPFPWADALSGKNRAGKAIRVITVQPRFDYTLLSPAKAAITAVRNEISNLPSGLAQIAEIGVTGDPVLRAEELKSVVSKLGLSLGLSIVLVTLILWYAMRTIGRVLSALATLLAALVITTGFAALAVGALNLVSIAFVVLMVGLGIYLAIHFMAHLEEESGTDREIENALVQSGRSIGAALVLAALTTSVAFLAFTTTDFVGMAQFGMIGAAGVIIAFLLAITALPALVMLAPGLAGRPAAAGYRTRQITPGEGGTSRGNGAFATVAFWGMLALGLASLVIATQSRFDADPMRLRDPHSPSVKVYDWLVMDPDLVPLRLSLMANSEDEARQMAEKMAGIDGVEKAIWLGSLIPKDQLEKLDLIDLAYPSLLHAVKEAPAELTGATSDPVILAGCLHAAGGTDAQALAGELELYAKDRSEALDEKLRYDLFLFFPQLIERLAAQLDAAEVTVDQLPANLVRRFRAEDGQLRVEIVPSGDVTDPSIRARLIQAASAVTPEIAGPLVQIQGAATAISGAMAQAVAIALGAAAFLAWLWLRRVGDVLAILVPLILASGVTAAAGVILDIPFNYANIIVLPLMIGIGIDSGIHLTLRSRCVGGGVFQTSTPRAIIYSALTTIGAFATLGLSDHRGTASMGIMLAIALTAAVAMVMALTPMLITLGRRP